MFSAKHVGACIAILNIIYTFFALGNAIISYIETSEAYDVKALVWIVVYSLNILLNAFLLVRVLVRDLLAIKLWFALTITLFMLRVFYVDQSQTGPFISAFIFGSLVVMAVAYIKLRERQADVANRDCEAIRAANKVRSTSKSVTSYRSSAPRAYGMYDHYNYNHHTQNERPVHEVLDLGWQNELSDIPHAPFITTGAHHPDNSCCDRDDDINNCCDNASGGGGCDDSGGGDCGGGDCGGGDSGGGGGGCDD